MLVNMMLSDSLIYAIGVFGVLGIVSKMVASVTLNRLVKSASNMSKSKHKFMKLVKAKFEHASMANNGVDNVPIFVDKYIHEYKTLGMSIHSWQKIQKISLAAVCISGTLGSVLSWNLGFGSASVLEYATVGISATIILLATYQLVDENHRITGLRIYMVDYLENVLASRYEKANAKNRMANRRQMDEDLSMESKRDIEEMDKKKSKKIKEKFNVDNFHENKEISKEDVDNFDTSVIPSLTINHKLEGEKTENIESKKTERIVVTDTGFGWTAQEESHMPNQGLENTNSESFTEASCTGISVQEATKILESRIKAVRAVQDAEVPNVNKKQLQVPKFHIQTLEEAPKELQLTAMEQMLQEEAQKRNIAKEQAGTRSSVNSAMIREILEEYMA